jgi:hypothetical protein
MYQTVKQFEETGSVCNKHAKGHTCTASVHMEEVISAK